MGSLVVILLSVSLPESRLGGSVGFLVALLIPLSVLQPTDPELLSNKEGSNGRCMGLTVRGKCNGHCLWKWGGCWKRWWRWE